jgi:hypothetical protein
MSKKSFIRVGVEKWSFLANFLLMDPDPEEPNQCGSGTQTTAPKIESTIDG